MEAAGQEQFEADKQAVLGVLTDHGWHAMTAAEITLALDGTDHAPGIVNVLAVLGRLVRKRLAVEDETEAGAPRRFARAVKPTLVNKGLAGHGKTETALLTEDSGLPVFPGV